MRTNNNFAYEIVLGKINKMFVDMLYQRQIKSVRVDKIFKEYDSRLMVPIAASLREDGRMSVIDGQHRFIGCQKRGMLVVPTLLYKGLTIEKEAELFRDLNVEKSPLKTYDVFKASLRAGENKAIEIDEAVRRAGLEVANRTGGGYISAVGALNSVYEFHKTQNLEWSASERIFRTISALKHYDDDKASIKAWMIQGVAMFICQFNAGSENSPVNWDEFVTKIKEVPFHDLDRAFKTVSFRYDAIVSGGNGSAVIGSLVCQEIYNKGLRKNNKLTIKPNLAAPATSTTEEIS